MHNIIITSGYFNPLHIGHVEYLNLARQLGSMHICIINNDLQVKIKESVPFMPEDERAKIVYNLSAVDMVYLSCDQDPSVRESISRIVLGMRSMGIKGNFIFANGGDRGEGSIPEADLCARLGVELVFGLGDKIRSSSELIASAREAGRES